MKKLPDTYEFLAQRLLEKSKDAANGCREWTGTKYPDGYGTTRFRRKNCGTHRLSWDLHNGLIPHGMSVLHKCDNPPCINPEHLFLGTQKDNIADMKAKGRQRGAKGVTNASSKLNPEKAFEIRWLNASGWSWNKLAREYGVHKRTVGRIIHHKIWPMECRD